MDIRKLPPIINGIGVIVMFVWGQLGHDSGHSWIAVVVSGVISGMIYTLAKPDNEEKKEDKAEDKKE